MAIDPAYLQIGWTNPSEVVSQGVANGFNWSAAAENAQLERQKNEIEQSALKMKLAQQQVQKEELYKFSLIPNKTADDYAKIMSKYPDLAEPYQKAWSVMDDGRQKQTLSTTSQVYAALGNNAPDVAKSILDEQIKGYENSGMKKEAFNLRNISNMIDKNPEAAKASLGFMMSSVAPDQFKSITEGLNSSTALPSQIAKTQAETGKLNAEAQGQNIENQYKPQQIESDLKNVNSQISSRKADDEYKQQQLFFEKNKPVNFGVDKEGRKYAVMPNGDARYVKDAQGNYITDIKSEKPMTATMQKELFETDDAIASSQSVISNLKEALRLSPISYDGVNADTRASLAGNLGLDKERSKNTAMLNNIMTSNALDALKSTFGAAPTEGERKILLDIQGSVNLPAKQREAIYTRALQAATKRLNTNQKKADAIRGGSYTSSEYNNATAPQQQQAPKPVARSFFD